jgi:hypothetical protein
MGGEHVVARPGDRLTLQELPAEKFELSPHQRMLRIEAKALPVDVIRPGDAAWL